MSSIRVVKVKFRDETFLTHCELKKPFKNDDSKQYASCFVHLIVATGKIVESCYFEVSCRWQLFGAERLSLVGLNVYRVPWQAANL